MSIRIQYYWIGAYDAGITVHPSQDLKNRGVETLQYEAFGISDASLIEVDKLPDPMPIYCQVAPITQKFTGEK